MNRLFIFTTSILLFACSCSYQIDERLVAASSLIESNPDSALKLLDSIPHPQKMDKASRAEYALLLTQARDKNYILPANDSLIRVAVDYYRGGSDREREMKAYFYLGCVYRDLGKETEAIKAYLEALKKMPSRGYSKFRKMLYSNLGLLYKEQGFYPESMAIFRSSHELCLQENDSANIIFPLRNIAHVFLLQNQVDSSLHYYQEALTIAEAISDSQAIPILLSSLSLTYTEKKDLAQAYQYVERAIRNYPSRVSMYDYYRKGNLLLNMNQLDSARYYLRHSMDSEDIYIQAGSHLSLYELEKRTYRHKEAFSHIDSYRCLNDSIDKKKHRSEISGLMNKHEIAMQANQLKLEHKNKTIWFSILFFCVLTACLSIFMIISKQKKQLIIKLQQEVISSHARLEELAHPQHEPTQDNAEPEPDVFNRLSILVNSFEKKEEIKKFHLNDFHKGSNIDLSSEERKQLFDMLHSHFSDILPEVVRLYGLSDSDFLYCILYLCGFSTAFIADVMSLAPGSLRSRKHRLQKFESSREFAQMVFDFNK